MIARPSRIDLVSNNILKRPSFYQPPYGYLQYRLIKALLTLLYSKCAAAKSPVCCGLLMLMLMRELWLMDLQLHTTLFVFEKGS
jgi:hypothetical protein